MNVPERLTTLSRTQVAALLGVLLLMVTPVALAASGIFTSGSTFKTDSGLSVQVNQDQSLSGNPFTDSQTFEGDGGTVSATSSGDGYLEVKSWGESGETVLQNVSVTGTRATITPNGSEKLRVSGTASEVRWDSIAADDSTVDLKVDVSSGDTASVTVFNVNADQQYKLVDQNGDTADTTSSDGSGTVTFDVSQTGDYQIKTFDNSLPQVSNLDPDGENVGDTVTLAADVDDDTLPGDNVTVTFRVDGTQVHQTTITQTGRVNYTLTQSELPSAGQTSWSVTAEDTFGSETTETASFVVPGNITVRNVSNPSEVIPDATVTVYTDSGSVELDADSNGNVSLANLPANQPLVMEISAPNYTTRTFTIPSVVQASDAYLIPNGTDTVLNRFTLEDATGAFDSEAIVYIERPIERNNTTIWRTVAGDQFGVEGASLVLEQDQRYRVRIVAESGAVAQLGKYTAELSEEVPLRPQSPTVELSGDAVLAYNASVDGSDLVIEYVDPTNETDVLTVSVVNRFNDSDYLLEPQTYYGTNSLLLSEPVGSDGLQDSYVVVFEGQRDGESFSATVAIGPDQIVLVPGGLSTVWVQIAGMGSLLLVAGVFSRLNVAVGVVATSLLGGIWWFIGLLPGVATWATVALAITFSVVYAMVIQR